MREIGGRYYAVDNGVWFSSAAATGPWVVADEVPEDKIAQIPPSAPVYSLDPAIQPSVDRHPPPEPLPPGAATGLWKN